MNGDYKKYLQNNKLTLIHINRTVMDLNVAPPLIMHIDLNSCFASVEQQANHHLRNRPIAVSAYNSPHGCIISPSIEAKKMGIKVGMRVADAQKIVQDIVILTPDPPKYRDVHDKCIKIFSDYTPQVTPKSIDEAILDFSSLPKSNLHSIAHIIKKRIKNEIGEWIRCSIGISTNRFLAKVAAGLHKPDGLDMLHHTNLIKTYAQLNLIDLPGINIRNETRLNASGIYSVLDFLHADMPALTYQVFQSIIGYYWYLRLRGYEVDNVHFPRRTYGQQYTLGKKTNNIKELSRLMMKLCEKMGRRLRADGYLTQGIHVACKYDDGSYWHKSKKFHTPFSTTWDLHRHALIVYNQQPIRKIVVSLSVHCFNLIPTKSRQMTLFDSLDKEKNVYSAVDLINDRWGEYTIVPARMMNMNDLIIDRIAFGK